MTRARYPDEEGFVETDGVKLFYEVYDGGHGEDKPTIFLLPSWAIVHSRAWKAQIPFLSRHYRVITADGRGSGKSDKPGKPEDYNWTNYVSDAIAVMDVSGTGKAVVVGCSLAGHLAALVAAALPERIVGAVLISPSAPFGPVHDYRLESSNKFEAPAENDDGWNKFNAAYWRKDFPGFIEWFDSQIFTEPHSTKQIEDCVTWGTETTAEVLISTNIGRGEGGGDADTYRGLACPLLLVHGEGDAIIPLEKSRYLAELCGGRLLVLPGSGHAPQGRIPAKLNLVFKEFVDDIAGKQADPIIPKARGNGRAKRALYLSSPIGLGHGRRDLAIARELRIQRPDLQIDWLAQHPVTALLESAGETIHPASRLLANESKHIEAESDGHDLHVFEAYRRMDEILVANFMLFQEVVSEGGYDLILGDEAWDVDYFWHEHPELKRAALVWFTDFVGFLPMPEKGQRDIDLTADYNAEMIGHVESHPSLRDRSIFVGDPEDCVDLTMGPGLPKIRDWTEEHFDFCGYITGYDPAGFGSRDLLRAGLGYRADQQVVIVTVGGSGVGLPLLQCIIQAYPMAKQRNPALRMIVVAGPRIDPAALRAPAGVELRAFVPDLPRHLAACDLAIVQGGLTTCMELTASGTPFIYVPLKNHFEQNFHVHHRLRRYNAGRRMDFEDCEPDALAAAIAEELSRDTAFRPVETDGAARAAGMIAEMI